MKIIVGLGNIGKKYELTRHNAGFIAIDQIASQRCVLKFKNWQNLLDVTSCEIAEHRCILAKPLLYMNRSGGPVQAIVNFYKINIDDLIVVHDELDLPTGSIKIKKGGGNAGHNGLKSIDSNIGNKYTRIRIGIGKPQVQEVADYVLEPFKPNEMKTIENINNIINEYLPMILDGDIEGCNSKIRNRILPILNNDII